MNALSNWRRSFNGQAIRFEELYDTCDRADIVITSTGAPHAIFRREHGERFLAPAQEPAHVLHRYCGASRRRSGDEQAGRHLRL